jgi:hypothetical protein
MVTLISPTNLERLNIDSIERAIVLSALALRTAITGLDDEAEAHDKVEITTVSRAKNELYLNLNVTLPLNPLLLATFGGSILSSIEELDAKINDLESTFRIVTYPSLFQVPTIPEYPSSISTFEQYFYYYASILYASLDEIRNQTVKIAIVDNNDEGLEVSTRITLPLDANKFALGHNLVESVDRVTDSYIDASSYVILSSVSSILSNNTFLDNSHILVN